MEKKLLVILLYFLDVCNILKNTVSYGIIMENTRRKDMEFFQSLTAKNISLYLKQKEKYSRSVLNRGYIYE